VIKRLTWFVGGVVAGAAGAGAAKRKVKRTASDLSPVRAVRRVRVRLSDAVRHGRHAAAVKEVELRARRDGRIEPLADALADGDVVYVHGRPVEPNQVVVLRRQPSTDVATRRRRRRSRA
jgi:hypothetical protein